MKRTLFGLAIGILTGLPAVAADRPVTLGLFLPATGPDAEAAGQVRRGAEIALRDANRDGGVSGTPLRLAAAASDGSWDGAARALVRLIYDEGAVAVAGALDARGAHVAEQVIARARGEAIFVSVWASEETLTRVRIPWFFRIVPDDRRQGAALAGEIFSVRGIARAAAWADDSLDARAAAESFLRAAPAGRVALHRGDPASESFADLAARAGRSEYGAVVLFGDPRAAAAAASRLRAGGFTGLMAGTLRLARREFVRGGAAVEGTLLAAPALARGVPSEKFARSYRSAWGDDPDPPALYGYDAVTALVAALKKAGPPPTRFGAASGLAGALARSSGRGLTGSVRFDGRRDRDQSPPLATVEGGRLVPLDGMSGLREASR